MLVFCPKCGTSTDVDAAAASAACSACQEALPVHLPKFGPPEMGPTPQAFGLEDMAAARPVAAPSTPLSWLEQQMPDGAWYVVVRARGAGCFGAAFFASVVAAALYYGSSAKSQPVVAALLLLLAAGSGYLALGAAVNRGILRIDGDAVSFRWGPLPMRGSFGFPTSDVTCFLPIRGPTSTGPGGVKKVVWAIQVISVAGPTRLPLPMMDRDRADALVARLTQMLTDARRQGGLPAPPSPF